MVNDENGLDEMNYKTATTGMFFSFPFLRSGALPYYPSRCIRSDSPTTRMDTLGTGRPFFDLTNRRKVQFTPRKRMFAFSLLMKSTEDKMIRFPSATKAEIRAK